MDIEGEIRSDRVWEGDFSTSLQGIHNWCQLKSKKEI